MDTLTTSWGRGLFLRALNIPVELRGKICYCCGKIIKWGSEANLKDVPVPFSAHFVCQKHVTLIVVSPEKYAEEVEIRGKSGLPETSRPVDDETFQRNLEKCVDFLGASWKRKAKILFLNFIKGEEL